MSSNLSLSEQLSQLGAYLDVLSTLMYYDSLSQKVNTVVCTLGILLNLFHFSVLCRKELRSTALFTLLAVLCICDVFLLSLTLREQLQKILKPKTSDEFCYGYDSLVQTMTSLLSNYLKTCAVCIGSAVLIAMGFVQVICSYFPQGSWTASFSKTSTSAVDCTLTITLSTAVYQFIHFLFNNSIALKSAETACEGVANLSAITENQYIIESNLEYPRVLFVIKSLDTVFAMIEPTLHIGSILFLIKSWKVNNGRVSSNIIKSDNRK
ncbi:unnamed protein product [Caenorhabditis sp. 36 PRJEB53466]|nr:unnamed protein product [Caenorhabditis sp. 36 PRJEB53466]